MGREESPGPGAWRALLSAPGLATGSSGFIAAMRWERGRGHRSWVRASTPTSFQVCSSSACPDLVQQSRNEELSGFVTVNPAPWPWKPDVVTLYFHELLHINLQLWDLLFLAVIEVSVLLQDPLLQGRCFLAPCSITWPWPSFGA